MSDNSSIDDLGDIKSRIEGIKREARQQGWRDAVRALMTGLDRVRDEYPEASPIDGDRAEDAAAGDSNSSTDDMRYATPTIVTDTEPQGS